MTTAASDAVSSGYAGREVWGAFIDGAFVETGDSETFEVMSRPRGGRSRGW